MVSSMLPLCVEIDNNASIRYEKNADSYCRILIEKILHKNWTHVIFLWFFEFDGIHGTGGEFARRLRYKKGVPHTPTGV